MRLIDAVPLTDGIELHRQPTDQKYEMDRQWAVGYNAGLDRALYSVAYAPTITPLPNDPLTLEELREMDGEPVWIVEEQRYAFLRDGGGYLCVSRNRLQWGLVVAVQAGKTVGGMTFYRRRPEEVNGK